MARSLPLPVLPGSLRWLFVAAIAGGILYWSVLAIPPQEAATVPPGAASTVVEESTTQDSTAPIALQEWRHFIAYLALGLSLAYALVTATVPLSRKVVLVAMSVILFGVFIEVSQVLVPRRSFTLHDLAINTIAGLTSTTWYVLERFAEPRHLTDSIRQFTSRL